MVLLERHADEQGPSEYNLALGDRRTRTPAITSSR
jgi:outer membrane protein OmpA-like peptidoglycan-associated protein